MRFSQQCQRCRTASHLESHIPQCLRLPIQRLPSSQALTLHESNMLSIVGQHTFRFEVRSIQYRSINTTVAQTAFNVTAQSGSISMCLPDSVVHDVALAVFCFQVGRRRGESKDGSPNDGKQTPFCALRRVHQSFERVLSCLHLIGRYSSPYVLQYCGGPHHSHGLHTLLQEHDSCDTSHGWAEVEHCFVEVDHMHSTTCIIVIAKLKTCYVARVAVLLNVVQDALDPVWKLHEQKHVPLRTAAFVYALENVIKVAKARGYGG